MTIAGSFTGCRFKEDKMWDVDLLVPIAHADLKIEDLIKSADISGTDSNLTLALRLPLHEVDMGQLIQVPDTTLTNTVSLKKLKINDRSVGRKITLGEVARNAGLAGQFILFSHGQQTNVPPLNNLSSGDIDINATSFFETATFISGKLILEIKNGFPIEIRDVHFTLRNFADDALVIEDTITSLMPGATFTAEYPLDGKTVEGRMVGNILNMNSPGSGANKVYIDTTDALELTITASELKLFSATSIFPAQNVVEDSVDIVYNLGGAKLTFMKIKHGFIRIVTAHTLQDSLFLRYTIPGAKLNGMPLDVYRKVFPAKKGDTAYASEDYLVDGYEVDLRGRNMDSFNTFFNILTASIDSTGKLVELSLADSIYIFYGLLNVVPEYARGYLGNTTVEVGPDTFTTDAFNRILSGEIKLEDISVNLEVSNGVGAPGSAMLKNLTAYNTRTGKSVALTGSVLSTPFNISPATDNPLTPSLTNLVLNSTNSNIKELMEILPDKFLYNFLLEINPQGNTGVYSDFIYSESKIDASLNIEMPLHLGIEGLTIADTIPLDLTETGDLSAVQEGKIYFQVENGFPFGAQLQVYILDDLDNIVDSLLVSGQDKVLAGQATGPSLYVTSPSESKLVVNVNAEKWAMLQQYERIMVKARFDTYPTGQKVKIYSDYFLRLKISTDVRYRNSY